MLLRWRCIGKTVPFLSPTGRRSAHILRLTAILSPTLSAYRTFRCAWTFSWWIPLFDEIRTGRIHDRGSRDDGNRLSPPAAWRIARRSKCSGFDDDSPWSTWSPARYGHLDAVNAGDGTSASAIPLCRHMPCSTSSATLLRCDTADRRMKCPLFDDKVRLRAILFPKGVDNSVCLWYNLSWSDWVLSVDLG